MTDDRRRGSRMQEDGVLEHDLEALRRSTAHHVPPLEHTLLAARSRPAAPWRERLMTAMNTAPRRPWIATATVAIVAAVALLVVPISYERTVGQQVSMTLSAANLEPQALAPLAQEMKALLGAPVTVALQNENGARSATLVATVSNASSAGASAIAQAFAGTLQARGYQVAAAVKPMRERVSGSVYAYARDQVIRVDLGNKSAAEIEAEVRSRLAEAGIPVSEVSVSEESTPDGKKKLKLEVGLHHERTDGDPEGAIAPELILTRDGQDLSGDAFTVKVMKKKDHATGAATLSVEVRSKNRSATAEVPNYETLGDAAVAAAIESQLAAAGIPARVQVTGDRIQVEPIE